MTSSLTPTLRLGVLTIGQAPRIDLVPEISPLLPGIELVERGALDDSTFEEIVEQDIPESEHRLTTKLRDGRSVVIGESFVMERLPALIRELEDRTDAVLLACTGPFHHLEHRKPLIVPDRVICYSTAVLAEPSSPIGVISPLPEQQGAAAAKFGRRMQDSDILTASCSPYTSGLPDFDTAGADLRRRGAGIIALDCIGYTEEHRQRVARAAGVPVVLARSATARFAMEALSSTAALREVPQ